LKSKYVGLKKECGTCYYWARGFDGVDATRGLCRNTAHSTTLMSYENCCDNYVSVYMEKEEFAGGGNER
jgi:hypothetical protein